MKKLLARLLAKFNVNGRDLPVFLLSLLLAFSIWFLYNLSLDYIDYLQVPVVARCNIEGHSAVSSGSSEVIARCGTSGYNIMRMRIFGDRFPVCIDFKQMHSAGGEMFYVTADELQEYTHLIFGENVSLEFYLTDTLFFRFPFETYARVPVRPVYELEFRPQYTIVGDMEVEPDSVLVYGEPHRIEKIDYVYTNPIKIADVSSGIHGMSRLEPIRGIRFSEDAIHYSADVVRYVEINRTVPVTGRNVPEDKYMMVYPPYVDVRFRCTFPYTGNPEDDVDFFIDYEDFLNSRSGKCVVRTDDLPAGVIGYSAEPQIFECVVNDR